MGISLRINIESVRSGRHGNALLGKVSGHLGEPGILWIQGPNGSGKSTLTSILSGKAFIGNDLDITGTVDLISANGGRYSPTAGEGLSKYACQVAYLPQRVGASFLAIHHQDDICFGIEGRFSELHGTTIAEKDRSAAAWLQPVLDALDAWKHLPRRSGQSSYGEIRRMEFACAVSTQADLVILDEPFSGLDPRWRRDLSFAISQLSSSYPSIWIITAHDSPQNLGVDLSPKTTITLEASARHRPAFLAIAKFVAEQLRNYHAIGDSKRIEAHEVKIERRLTTGAVVELPILIADPGKITWIQGENGAGKSTICAVLAGLLRKTRSQVVTGLINGRPLSRHIPAAPNESIKLALQDPYQSFVHRTVKEELLSVWGAEDSDREETAKCLQTLISQLEDEWGSLDRKPATFSFGQLRFLQLLLFPPSASVLIFDEPFLGLAPSLHEPLLDALKEIAAAGRIVICTCHDSAKFGPGEPAYCLASASQRVE